MPVQREHFPPGGWVGDYHDRRIYIRGQVGTGGGRKLKISPTPTGNPVRHALRLHFTSLIQLDIPFEKNDPIKADILSQLSSD